MIAAHVSRLHRIRLKLFWSDIILLAHGCVLPENVSDTCTTGPPWRQEYIVQKQKLQTNLHVYDLLARGRVG